MAGDGSAVKSEPSNTPTVGAAELLKITHSASAMKQNSRWRRVRDKVEVKGRMTVDTVQSTLSFFKKSKKSKSESVFSEELKRAKLSMSCNQSIWKLSLQRRRSSSKAFTLDSVRATTQFRGWCKSSRPNQNCFKSRGTTRKVGPKMSARRKEVMAWCESVLFSTSCHKSQKRAAEFLAQQEIRGICHEVSSVAMLASVTISFNVIRSWQQPLDQSVIDYWVPKQASQSGPAAFNTFRSWLNSDSSLKSFVIGNAMHRWSQLCPTRASTQLSYDQSLFTCKELNKRLNCAAEFGLVPEKESMSLPKLGSNNNKQRASLARAQRKLETLIGN